VKGFLSFLVRALLLAAMMIAGPRAGAQQFGLSVTPSANSILVGNSLTYTITVTYLNSGSIDAVVTNFLPGSAQFQSATNYYNSSGVYSTNPVVFGLNSLPSGDPVQMTVTVLPTAVGSITDTVIVASTDSGYTNTVSTNVVVQVTNVVILADLGVTMTGPSQVVITNDWMTYGVTVTNAGPNTAVGVMLTNTLPPGVIGIFPTTNQAVGSNIITVFTLGTLTNGSFTNLFFTVAPTNAGILPFSASVGSGTPDTNTANNFASTNITVTNYLPGQLVAGTNSSQSYNPQNGLVEQSVTVTNIGTNAVDAVRVVVTGLTNGFLANAVGTNAGNPFVVFAAMLNTNQSVNLLMQYYTPTRSAFSFSNSELNPFAVFVPDLAPPTAAAVSTNINIYRILMLTNGDVLLEWPTITNQTYTVVYSDNVSFSNAMIAPPSITALGTRLQWIDYGPPTTVSAPTNAPVRFYRVYQNP
jgi:uncharacterized repeat protein (TIGR01451 family)